MTERATTAPDRGGVDSHGFARYRWGASPWVVALATVFVAGRGRLNYDTKYLLHVDAGGLMSLSRHAWDPMQYGGYVAHQAVGYVWPSGPFHAVGQWLGIESWVMQRLWLAVLFGAAGSGVYAWLRFRAHGPRAAAIAALLYQTSPFVLAYQARTSLMLLPWASLGWLALVTMRGVRSPRWRYIALAALIVATAGGINATALVLVVPALALVAVEEVRSGSADWRRVLAFGLGSFVLSVLMSLWWIVMVVLQGRYGSRVLFFSETLEDVSLTSTAFEIFRGLGYWLNYVGLDAAPITSAARLPIVSTVSVAATLVVPVAAMVGLAIARRGTRRLAMSLVGVGLVLAVNVHPMVDPPRLWSLIADRPDSRLALSFRSSTRAIPVLLLGLSLAVAALLDSEFARARVSRVGSLLRAHVMAALLVLGVVVGVPARFSDGVVDATLSRGTNLPDSWRELGRGLSDIVGDNQRVLQLPGQEFAKYDWGYTGESALLAAQPNPVLIRELLPLGDEQFMNLLNAVNDAALEGRLDRSKLDDLAGLLGVGAVVFPADLDAAFYDTPDQETILTTNRVGETLDFGGHRVLAIPESTGILRRRIGETTLLGDGYGVVAASGWGVLGARTLRYAGNLDDSALTEQLASADSVVVTDSNRIRSQHWRTTRDWYGFSEDGTVRTAPLVPEQGDRRLQVFPTESAGDSTRFEQRGAVTARASGYGSSLRFQPERRPYAAIDGSVATAWTVVARESPNPVIRLTSEIPVSSLRLIQQQRSSNARISSITVRVDGSAAETFSLDTASNLEPGQLIALPAKGRVVTIRVESIEGDPALWGQDPIGFAELDLGVGATTEVGVLPTRGVDRVPATSNFSVVLSRDRAPAWDASRQDPETAFRREFTTPQMRSFTIRATVRGIDEEEAPDSVVVDIDGTSLQMRHTPGIRRSEYAAPSPIVLGAGVHEFASGADPYLIDEVVLSSVVEAKSGPGSIALGEVSSPTSSVRTGVVEGCPSGCWLVFGESYSRGWNLRVAGVDQGPSTQVDGGVNGWLVGPMADGTPVRLEFRPQRIADLAQLVSLATAAMCLLVLVGAFFRGRRRLVPYAAEPEKRRSPSSGARPERSRGGLFTQLRGPLVALAVGLLVLPDRWTAMVFVVASVAVLRPNSGARLLRWAAIGVVTSLAVGWMKLVKSPPIPSFAWTTTVDSVHSALMAFVVLGLVGSIVDTGPGDPE